MNRLQAKIGKLFHVIAFVLTLAATVPAAAILVWSLDRSPPVNNLSGRFDRWDSVDPPVALITWTGDRERICPGKAFRWIFADKPFNLHTDDLPPPGAHEQLGARGVVWTISVQIPREALQTTRPYVNLHVRKVWECNPIHHWWPLVVDPVEIPVPVPTPHP